MNYSIQLVHAIFPIIAVILLFTGLRKHNKNNIAFALWLSLIALMIHYQTSGSEILGSYFNYLHSLIYSFNLLVLLISIIYLVYYFAVESKKILVHYITGLLAAVSIICVLILLANLWMNALFIESRMPGTPVLQIATHGKLSYCDYDYIFYKINKQGKFSYLCPNYYGFIPSIGNLRTTPSFILKQMPADLKSRLRDFKAKQQ